MIDRLKRNSADLINLYIVPMLIALMPWSIGFPLLRFLARHDRSHAAAIDQAWSAASPHCPGEEADHWKWRFRLLRLLERVDTWLVLLRPSWWWSAQIEQSGDWPTAKGPLILLTYHWGGGHWIWRQLHEHGISAKFLAKRAQATDLGAGRLALWYARFRELGIERSGSHGVIFTGGSSGRIRQTVAAGRSVVGMMDLPAAVHQETLDRPLLDGVVRIPVGLARLANEVAAPVVLFNCSFDVATGRRRLKVAILPVGSPVEAIVTAYIAELDHCLRIESAFWQLWPAAPSMFQHVRLLPPTDPSDPAQQ